MGAAQNAAAACAERARAEVALEERLRALAPATVPALRPTQAA